MNELRPGAIVFYRAQRDNPIDRLIVGAQAAAGLPSWASHCGIALTPRYMIEAIRPVVRVTSLVAVPPAACVNPTYADVDAALDRAVASVGQVYDTLGVAAFGAGLYLPGMAAVVADVTRALGQGKLWCSEMTARALLAGGATLSHGALDPERCAPGTLLAMFGVAEP